MALSSNEFIKRFRDAYRQEYYGALDRMSDEAVYNMARKEFPDAKIDAYTPTTQKLSKVDTSPKTLNKLGEWIADMSDYIIDEDSWNDHKMAYNNSMTGLAYKTATGEDKYPEVAQALANKDYRPGIVEDVYAGLLSFTFPLDALTMLGSGGYGAWAGRGLAKQIGMKWAGKGASKKLSQQMLESSLGLGFFMGAANTVGEAAEQRVKIDNDEIDKFDIDKLAHAGMEGYLEGSVLGASVGAVGNKFAKSRAKILKQIKNAGDDVTRQMKIGKLTTSKPMEIAAESGVFTSIPYAWEGAPRNEDGSLNIRQVGRDLAVNTGVIGGLKLAFKAVEASGEPWEKMKNQIKDINEKKIEENKIAQNVVEKSGLDAFEIIEQAKEQLQKNKDFPKEAKQLEKVLEVLKEIEDPTDIKQINKAFDKYPDLLTHAIESKSFLREALEYLKENTESNELLRQIAKEQGIDVGYLVKQKYDGIIDKLQKVSENYNDFNYIEKNNNPRNVTKKDVIKTKIAGQTRDTFNKTYKTEEAQKRLWESTFQDPNTKDILVPWSEAPKTKKGVLSKKGINQLFDMAKGVREEKQLTTLASEKRLKEQFYEVVGKISPKSVRENVKEFKVREKATSYIPEVEKSNLIDSHKDFLSYTLDKSKGTLKKSHATEAINFLKWVENTYKTSIDKIPKTELDGILKEYIGKVEYKGKDIDIWTLTDKQIKKIGLNERQVNALRRHSDKIRDNLYLTFRKGSMLDIIGKDIVDPVTKFNVSGERQYNIPGGPEGINQWKQFSSTKDFHQIKKGVRISGEGLELAIDIATAFQARPGELPLFTLNNVNRSTGQITFKRQKQGVTKKVPSVLVDKKLAEAIHLYAEKMGIKTNQRVFGKLNGNDIAKYLHQNSNTKLVLEDVLMNETVKPEAMMDWWKVQDGKLIKTQRKASTNVFMGNIFRAIFRLPEGSDVDFIKSAAEKRGSTVMSAGHYHREVLPKQKATGKTIGAISPLKSKKVFTTDKQRAEALEVYKKRNKLTDEQLKEAGLDKNILGSFLDGYIRLQKGEWQPEAFFHENVHRLEALSRVANDKRMIKLFERGETLIAKSQAFKKWMIDNKGKSDTIEFLADYSALEAVLREKPRGMGGKVKRWLQDVITAVKVRFMGGKYANLKDIQRYIGKKVQKGFEVPEGISLKGSTKLIGGKRASGQIIRYKYRNQADKSLYDKRTLNDSYHQVERELISKGLYTKAELRILRENATGQKDWTFDNTPKEAINKWYSDLLRIQKNELGEKTVAPEWLKKSEKAEWEKQNDAYENSSRNYISEQVENSILKNIIGVKAGNIKNAIPEQIKKLSSIAEKIGEKPKDKVTVATDLQAMELLKNDTKWGKVMQVAGPFIAPVWYVMEKLGAKAISKKLLNHFATEYRHVGFASNAEFNMQRLIGEDGMNRLSYMADKERWLDREARGKLDSKDRALYNKIFDKNRKVKDTMEGKAFKEFDKLREYYWNEILEVANDKLLQGELTKAEHSRFLQQFNKKHVMDYFPRKLTKDFKKYHNPEQKWFKEMMNSAVKKEAEIQANGMFVTKGVTFKEAIAKAKKIGDKEQVALLESQRNSKAKEFYENPEIKMKAELELENMFEFSPETARNPYLFKRGLKLPEFVKVETDKGKTKEIPVYETRYAETMGDYSRTMSRFIATAENFPEYTGMFRKFGFPTVKSELLKQRVKDYGRAQWMLNRVKQQIGVLERDAVARPLTSALQKYATITSKIALSFPTAGLKNVVVGMPQTIAAFGMHRTIKAMKKAFNEDAQMVLRKRGAVEMGLKHLEEMKTAKVWEWIFKGGLMRPTENFNRITSIYAGRSYLAEAITRANDPKVRKHIKNFWKISDAEIDLLRKHGMQLSEVKSKNPILEPAIQKSLDNAIHKVDTWSHINTQGGSTTALVPYWFNAPMAKPFLLFQRMAYAATFNLKQNVIEPMNLRKGNRNIMPLVRFAFASTLGGYGLMQVYDWALGVQPPKANDSFWNQIINYMWKAEMLGIFSETLSPFQGDNQVSTSLYPAIHKNTVLLGNNILAIGQGKKTFTQGFDDSMRGVFSAYNQGMRMYERKLKKGSKYYKDSIALKRLQKDYKDKMNMPTRTFDDIPQSNRTKYYRDFKKAFSLGSPDDAAKKWLASLFAVTDSFIKDGGYTYPGAMKAALKEMKGQIDKSNPIYLSANKKGKVISNRNDFLLWLNPKVGSTGNQKHFDMAIRSQNNYAFKRRQLEKAIDKYVKENGLAEFYPLLKSQVRKSIH